MGQVQNHTEDDLDDWITETVGLKTDKLEWLWLAVWMVLELGFGRFHLLYKQRRLYVISMWNDP